MLPLLRRAIAKLADLYPDDTLDPFAVAASLYFAALCVLLVGDIAAFLLGGSLLNVIMNAAYVGCVIAAYYAGRVRVGILRNISYANVCCIALRTWRLLYSGELAKPSPAVGVVGSFVLSVFWFSFIVTALAADGLAILATQNIRDTRAT